MKRFPYILLLLCSLLAAACGENPSKGGKDKPDNTSPAAWSLGKPLVQKVEVRSDDRLIETYEYTYDSQGRLLTLLKTDAIQGEKLLDLQYSYPDDTGMKASGKFFPISTNRFVSAVKDPSEKTVRYDGSWSGAWTYVTAYDAGGTATATVSDIDFAAREGQYSAQTRYQESYTVSGGCITRSVLGTETQARSQRKTRTGSSSELTVQYSYSDQEDRQNFAVYLFPCNFPVWVAAGLPGCRKLITGISSARGSVASPATTKLSYSLTAEGLIDTATRTDFNDGQAVLVRTYKFYYL
ncbi:MAG: hypothetical protein IJ654_08125 [Bacteroidales bacterium]|nr:hypothetical protein [Bacteroidales bacterium]